MQSNFTIYFNLPAGEFRTSLVKAVLGILEKNFKNYIFPISVSESDKVIALYFKNGRYCGWSHLQSFYTDSPIYLISKDLGKILELLNTNHNIQIGSSEICIYNDGSIYEAKESKGFSRDEIETFIKAWEEKPKRDNIVIRFDVEDSIRIPIVERVVELANANGVGWNDPSYQAEQARIKTLHIFHDRAGMTFSETLDFKFRVNPRLWPYSKEFFVSQDLGKILEWFGGEPKSLTIRDYKITIAPDKSVTWGCKQFSKEDVEKFIEARKQIMGQNQ